MDDTILNINKYFKLPIFYLDKDKYDLNKTIINDLELIETKDDQISPLYNYYFNIDNKNPFSKIISKQFSEYYTTNKNYLKDSQKLIQLFESDSSYMTNICHETSILTLWDEIKNDNGFKEKYQFIDWSYFEYLNHSEQFLEMMSVYNLVGPIISVLTPVFILIIPFLILKIKKTEINFTQYIEVLKDVCKNHVVGKLFTTNYSEIDSQQVIYTIISACFYILSIYQNILTFIRFHENMKKIHNYLSRLSNFISYTQQQMDKFLGFSQNLKSYEIFNEKIKENKTNLTNFHNQLIHITEYKITNTKKLLEIGKVMKLFYFIYDNKELNESILFSFGFHGYLDCINGLQKNIQQKQINFCTFSQKDNTIINSYYGVLKDIKHIKNNIDLSNNFIVTGPNASGKTTILKSTIINFICNQQFGCGFYEKATQKLYNHLHCYLNIPDTSGRDSLFQAEARRCKEIIDCISEYPDENHFCIFDELYSGTNPTEAVSSAASFLEYLTKNKNVQFHLTTHFIKLCKKLKSNKLITNYCMETKKAKDKIIYKYKLKKGISTVKGGIHVLSNLNYPKEILNG
jgi:hypothetical protein